MRTVGRIGIAIVMLTAVAAAQQAKPTPAKTPQASPTAAPRPNFSGRWTVISPAEKAGKVLVVTQDQKVLTTEHPSEREGDKTSLPLDGLDRRMAIPGRGSENTMTVKAAWLANTIIITTNISYSAGRKTQSKEVWSIDPRGRLVIDFTETGDGQPGPSGKVIYVKKQP